MKGEVNALVWVAERHRDTTMLENFMIVQVFKK
jgi:hypothetical protein